MTRRNRLILASVALAAAILLAIARLGAGRAGAQSFAFDKWLLLALRRADDHSLPLGPAWLKPLFVNLTAVGSPAVLTIVVLAVLGGLLLARHHRGAIFLAATTGAGAIMGKLLKLAFGRNRPDVVPHLVDVSSLSFPSGHTVNSAIVYLTLGAMLARAQPTRALSVYVMATACLLIFLIGASRVYLGVHYPTDVLAGWAVGGSWAMICWAIGRKLLPEDNRSSGRRHIPSTAGAAEAE